MSRREKDRRGESAIIGTLRVGRSCRDKVEGTHAQTHDAEDTDKTRDESVTILTPG